MSDDSGKNNDYGSKFVRIIYYRSSACGYTNINSFWVVEHKIRILSRVILG